MEFCEVLSYWVKNKGCWVMKIWLGAGECSSVVSICLVCVRPYVQSLVHTQKRKYF